MLPGSGLFKDLPCPFFQDGEGCNRPYCHFKHITQETKTDNSSQKKPTYTPTPINKTKLEYSVEVVPKKKPKLEYIPVPSLAIVKNIKYNPSTIKPSHQAYIPSGVTTSTEDGNSAGDSKSETSQIYIPSKISKENEEIPMEVENSEVSGPSEPAEVDEDSKETEVKQVLEVSDQKSEDPSEEKSEIPEVKEDPPKVPEIPPKIEKSDEKSKENGEIENVEKEKSKTEESKKSERRERSKDDKEKERRHSHSKSSSREKDRHKKHSSSSSKSSSSKHSSSSSHKSSSSNSHKSHKSSGSSSKHRSSSSNDEKTEKSEKLEKSEKSRKLESSERSGKSDKSERSEKSSRSDKSSRSEKSRSSGKSEHSRHHSSSSSSSKTKHREKEKSGEKKNGHGAGNVDLSLCDFDDSFLPDLDECSDDEEDEVMKQCRMIFDEYSTKEPAESPAPEESTAKETTVLKDVDLFAPLGKKRQAYENADHARVLSTFLKKPDHVQNAKQAIYIRQEMVRKQKEQELAELEEKKKKLEEELKGNHTPLINPSVFLHPAKRPSITPISNLMALQEAKKKVEALKAAKQSPYLTKTVAQTAPKGQSRVAHEAKVDLKTKPAPPVLEPHQKKISYNIRMQYYNIMVTHCLNIYPNCEDAWDRAQTEELTVFKKCGTPNIYKSSALLAINKLKKESIEAGNVSTQKEKTISHDVMLAGKQGLKFSWSTNHKTKVAESNSSLMTIDNCSSTKAYQLVVDCILSETLLQENGFPRAGAKRGMAKMFTAKPSKPPAENERYCSRCSKVFVLDDYDEPGVDLCNYHLKRSGYRRGCADNIYYCCQQSAGSDGCCFANYHVTDYVDYDNLTGYVTTMDPEEDYEPSKKDMFALDCEMCYTTFGMELTRITVVNFDEKVVYDTLVRPENRVVDYNTKFSGITEQSLENIRTTLRDVQAVLLSMFNSKTILIGHSLESDLKALKLIHSTVVDTSVLFPHKMGPPRKRALKTLCVEHLKKIIQEDEQGHDSAEDSLVCIQLVKHYLRNRIL